jgi:hypothetical protein
MAIEAALNEDDFETAYSYVVNRLTTSSSSTSSKAELDDLSWRAALAAGRYKSTSTSPSSASSNVFMAPKLRRLEQRMELLSQTLLLAPPTALPEVLNVCRKCEEEMLALQAAEQAAEEEGDSRAEAGDGVVPGAFVITKLIGDGKAQPRREVGRGGHEESPMGLFDVARGAAAAFSRNAFPLRGATAAVQTPGKRDDLAQSRVSVDSVRSDGSGAGTGEERVRKRDMISSAVTGGLASGIGWVIGKS